MDNTIIFGLGVVALAGGFLWLLMSMNSKLGSIGSKLDGINRTLDSIDSKLGSLDHKTRWLKL
jgi:hypothetical protein